MIYTDFHYIASDNPTNDYEELKNYIKKFEMPWLNTYRHNGVPYYRIKWTKQRIIRCDKVLVVTKKEFLDKIKNGTTSLENFKLDLRAFTLGGRFRKLANDMIQAAGYPKQPAVLIDCKHYIESCYAECKIKEKKHKPDVVHFLINNENRLGKCWVTRHEETIAEIPTTQSVIDVIIKNTKYQPHRII